MTVSRPQRGTSVLWLLTLVAFAPGIAIGQEAKPAVVDAKPHMVQFSFEGTPWRDVIKWLADEGNLALHVGEIPTGSFTYTDDAQFTHDQAIARVNLFLVPQGFTLVRSGRLLSVINMSDPRSMQQLDAMAELVSIDKLSERNAFDVVKCIFKLEEIDSDDAVQELTALNLMLSPTVLEKTNQLIITDTVAKLRNVNAILSAFDATNPDEPVVSSFQLKHASVEDVLTAVRPHIGLATGEYIGIDISLSADPLGQKIFVTGLEDKVKLLKSLIEQVDKAEESDEESMEPAFVKAHPVKGGNVETVYSVLQTLLSGKKSIRVSMDKEADSIVAMAPPKIQQEIEQTITEIQASDATFAVIPLRIADPFVVVSLLEEMLDLPDALDDPEDIDPDAPKIDADPANMRLYVRAKKPQIDQIREIVEGLDNATSAGDEDNSMRLLPLRGAEAKRVLDTAAKFWRESNPIIFYDSDVADEPVGERVVNANEKDAPAKTKSLTPAKAFPEPVMLTSTKAVSQSPIIRCQLTSRGLIIQSDDGKALDRFEDHLRMIAGPMDSSPSRPIVFYLKYTKSDDAIRMLAELLDGGDTIDSESGSSLVNGYVSSGSSNFLGTLITTRDGTMTLSGDTLTIVGDSRLNRLIAQGTVTDIEKIEAYLQIIDKDKSITSIETYGTSHVIELMHAKAADVAQVVREAYASRVAKSTGTQPGQAAQPGQKPQATPTRPDPRAAAADPKAKKGAQPKSQPARNLEPTMTVTVHEASNSLIVTAPNQLFVEVELLVKSIDSKAEEDVQVIAGVNAELYGSLIQEVMTGETSEKSSKSTKKRN